MGRVGLVGFDTGAALSELSGAISGSGVTFDSSVVRTGGFSLKVVSTSGANSALSLPNLGTGEFYQIYIRPSVLPASTARVIVGTIAGSTINLRLNPSGTIAFFVNTISQGNSTTALTDTSKWYRIQWRGGTGTSVPVLIIDGVTELTKNPSSWTTTKFLGATDTVADTYAIYYDDLSQDDANLPDDEKIALLVPVSDNARDTLWTGGAGGTTNLFAAVDNRPPTGTASETDSTQIEHAGGASGTTDRYDANLTTYTDAGISSGDTVNAVMPFVVHGEDAGAGTKVLNMEVLSNPTVSSAGNFNAGDDIGALGTFPTNWRLHKGNIVNSPSVTLGTSPVMRISRPETASRVASVCFMGMYVAYTPGEAPVEVAATVPQRKFRMMRGLGQ